MASEAETEAKGVMDTSSTIEVNIGSVCDDSEPMLVPETTKDNPKSPIADDKSANMVVKESAEQDKDKEQHQEEYQDETPKEQVNEVAPISMEDIPTSVPEEVFSMNDTRSFVSTEESVSVKFIGDLDDESTDDAMVVVAELYGNEEEDQDGDVEAMEQDELQVVEIVTKEPVEMVESKNEQVQADSQEDNQKQIELEKTEQSNSTDKVDSSPVDIVVEKEAEATTDNDFDTVELDMVKDATPVLIVSPASAAKSKVSKDGKESEKSDKGLPKSPQLENGNFDEDTEGLEDVDISEEPLVKETSTPGDVDIDKQEATKEDTHEESSVLERNSPTPSPSFIHDEEFATRWKDAKMEIGKEHERLIADAQSDFAQWTPSMLSSLCKCLSLTWMFTTQVEPISSGAKARRAMQKAIISPEERKAALAAFLYPLAVVLPAVAAASDDEDSTSRTSGSSAQEPPKEGEEEQDQEKEPLNKTEKNHDPASAVTCPMCWTACTDKRPHFDCPNCCQTFHNDCVVTWLEHQNHQECPCCKTELMSQKMLNKFVRKQRKEDGQHDDPQLWEIADLSVANEGPEVETTDDNLKKKEAIQEVVFRYDEASSKDLVDSELSESLAYQFEDEESEITDYFAARC